MDTDSILPDARFSAAASRPRDRSEWPPALVIGMSIHGLAIARALARHGVDVHALAQNLYEPAAGTRFATVHCAEGINSSRLSEILLDIRSRLPGRRPVVLFPSSDNMVRAIANAWESLEPHYLLGWHRCRERVLELQSKASIGGICQERGIAYPESFVVRCEDDLAAPVNAVGFPLLVKPVRSLSLFKAIKTTNESELYGLFNRYASELPFLVQRWIEGDDSQLYFCTVYLHEERVVCRFVGRKIRSRPRGTGMGTVVEDCSNDEVAELTDRFLDGLKLSGPVAVEFKRDPDGRFWLIEPNVGRTEYSVDLLIQHGLNLPLVEYWAAQGILIAPVTDARRPVMWFDTERDTAAYVRACLAERTLRPGGRTPIFPYYGHGDPKPLVRAVVRRLLRPWTSAAARLRRRQVDQSGLAIEIYPSIERLPAEAVQRLGEYEQVNLFYGIRWFENYEKEVGRHEGTPEWYCVYNAERQLLAVWPFVRMGQSAGRVLKAMGNYYSPYLTLITKTRNSADDALLKMALVRIVHSADHVVVSPVAPDDLESSVLAERSIDPGMLVVRDYYTTNWYQPVEEAASYFDSRDSKLKHTIARKSRKLAREADVRVRILTSRRDLEPAIGDYFKVYDGSWKLKEPYPEFVANLIRLSADEGWLRLGIMYVDGEPAAAQIWFVQNHTAYIYKLAYDERFSSRSVGTLLTTQMIEHVVTHDRVSKLDYLTGDDRYKRSWMDHHRQLNTVTVVNLWRPRGAVFYLRHVLSRLVRRIRRQPRGERIHARPAAANSP